MQRIALTTGDGYAISMRADTIEMFQDSEGESLIRTTTGLQLSVKETTAEIDALIIASQHRITATLAGDFKKLAQAFIDFAGASTFRRPLPPEAYAIIECYYPGQVSSDLIPQRAPAAD